MKTRARPWHPGPASTCLGICQGLSPAHPRWLINKL
ncbi:unnamed protein product, partial [Gulo gulo]